MRPFEFHGSVEAFVEGARRALRQLGFDDIVSIKARDNELIVRFSKLGTSELRFRVVATESGFRSEPVRTRVAAFHAPFRRGFEDRFTEVLGRVGATIL